MQTAYKEIYIQTEKVIDTGIELEIKTKIDKEIEIE